MKANADCRGSNAIYDWTCIVDVYITDIVTLRGGKVIRGSASPTVADAWFLGSCTWEYLLHGKCSPYTSTMDIIYNGEKIREVWTPARDFDGIVVRRYPRLQRDEPRPAEKRRLDAAISKYLQS